MISSGSSAVVSAPEEELLRRDHARAGLAGHRDLGVAGDRDAGHLGRRIGMGDAAADRAAVADLVMRDVLDGGDQQRMRVRSRASSRMSRQRTMRAEPHAGVGDLDRAEAGQLAQVDQQRGRRHAERQHRHQRLAAGDHLGVAVVRRQQRDRLGSASPDTHIRRRAVSCRGINSNRVMAERPRVA